MKSKTGLKSAFTMAEVLITLGIIGIVAAMTLPSLMTKFQDKELITRAKKAFSNISNAVRLAQSENGVYDDISYIFDPALSSEEVAQKFSKYFNGATVCLASSATGCSNYFYGGIQYATYEGNADYHFKNLPKIILTSGAVIGVSQNKSCTVSLYTCDGTNPDGSCQKDENGNDKFHYENYNFCATLQVDVNGPSKPNQYGRDIYSARIHQNGKITYTDWSPTGSRSAQNILSGKDKLDYTRH